MKRLLTLAFALVAATGCASVDEDLYHLGETPRLKDGAVRMTSHWTRSQDGRKDVRTIEASGGVVTCSWESPRHGTRTGTLSEDAWVALWQELRSQGAFGIGATLDERPDEPKGGVYHLVELELDGVRRRFSSQFAPDILIFTTKDVTNRVRLSNRIADLVSEGTQEDSSL